MFDLSTTFKADYNNIFKCFCNVATHHTAKANCIFIDRFNMYTSVF